MRHSWLAKFGVVGMLEAVRTRHTFAVYQVRILSGIFGGTATCSTVWVVVDIDSKCKWADNAAVNTCEQSGQSEFA